MKKKLVILLTLMLVLISLSAYADRRDFVIVNDTGYPIKFIGINPPGDEMWNENELNAILANKDGFKVEFDSGLHKGCVWNIKVTWADDNTSAYFRNVDLCTISLITLKYDRKTDTASYTYK